MADETKRTDAAGDDTTAPVSGARSDGSAVPLPGSIGRYRVLGRLGEGGMGLVYLAEQPSPRRHVAVKVIRGGRLVSEQEVHLFLREAESLARLKHPGIAAIYEAGRTEDGRHYFVMEYVQGETLGTHLAREPWLLPMEEIERRLRLVAAICQAVHYAHQRGVIHRDLKPGNVIVTGVGANDAQAPIQGAGVKILDFGLARISDPETEATATQAGAIRGTLAYMSPEQARGDPSEIDLRTDVYSLGVILYEALAGARPVDVETRSLVDALNRIVEVPPRPLRDGWRGIGRLDPDIETIVLKAIEKEPDRRYASAAALADDIDRYLASQPIQARPPSGWYQARKFAQRNRALVAGAGATLLAVVAGAVVSTVLGFREAAQRQEAERARAEVEQIAEFQGRILSGLDSEATGHGIARAARDVLARALEARGRPRNEIEESLSRLDAALGDVNTTDLARRVLHENVLAPAAATAAAEFTEQPTIEAALLETLARTYRTLGMPGEAEPHARRALALRRQRQGGGRPETLDAALLLASILAERGSFDEASTLLASALETLRRIGGSDDPKTLDAAYDLGLLEWRLGRFDRADEILRETLERQRRVLGDADPRTVNSMNVLAGTLYRLGRNEEAERLWSEVLTRRRQDYGDDDRRTLAAMNNLGNTAMSLGRLDQADALFAEAFDRFRSLLGEAHPETLQVLLNRARVAELRGDIDGAEARYGEVIAIRRRVRGLDHPDTLLAMNQLGVFLTSRGRLEEARALLADLVGRANRVLGKDSSDAAQYVHSYAECLLAAGDLAGARARLREAIEVYEKEGGAHLGLARRQAAVIAARLGDRNDALANLREALRRGSPAAGLVDDPAFLRYRDDPEFAALIGPAASR